VTVLPGHYFCAPGHGFAGWLVRHGTASPFGHSGIVVTDNHVVEALGEGVAIRPLSKYLGKPGVVFNDNEPLTDTFLEDAVAEALKLVGAPYDAKVNIDIAVSLIFQRSKTPLLPPGKNGAYNCSQAVAAAYTNAGKVMFPTVDRWRVSPRLLADRITQRPWESSQ
jgi:uncharacterized protein YycO